MLKNLTWPAPLARMEAAQRHLTLALAISLLLHAILLSIHFTDPQALNRVKDSALEVILVNSKSARSPQDAQALAQANLDGGGNTEQKRRIKTPLPAAKQTQESNELMAAQRRVAELEAQQRQMLKQAKSMQFVREQEHKSSPPPDISKEPPTKGKDLAANALAIARLQGQIDRQTEMYNQRPRKAFIGARTKEYAPAQYLEDWRQKVERVGNLNYPAAARGQVYGALTMTIEINADGTLLQPIIIDRSSGKPLLDEAAKRIVVLAAPYAPFPPELRKNYDVISITRTWAFTNGDRLETGQ